MKNTVAKLVFVASPLSTHH